MQLQKVNFFFLGWLISLPQCSGRNEQLTCGNCDNMTKLLLNNCKNLISDLQEINRENMFRVFLLFYSVNMHHIRT